jgi:hypothetical protein
MTYRSHAELAPSRDYFRCSSARYEKHRRSFPVRYAVLAIDALARSVFRKRFSKRAATAL